MRTCRNTLGSNVSTRTGPCFSSTASPKPPRAGPRSWPTTVPWPNRPPRRPFPIASSLSREEVRAAVFTELLAANFYWQETFGATLSWNADLEEVVLIYQLKHARMKELERQSNEAETRQTETLSDQQIVDLVENAIRSNPQDFPLLTKYYLEAA